MKSSKSGFSLLQITTLKKNLKKDGFLGGYSLSIQSSKVGKVQWWDSSRYTGEVADPSEFAAGKQEEMIALPSAFSFQSAQGPLSR